MISSGVPATNYLPLLRISDSDESLSTATRIISTTNQRISPNTDEGSNSHHIVYETYLYIIYVKAHHTSHADGLSFLIFSDLMYIP